MDRIETFYNRGDKNLNFGIEKFVSDTHGTPHKLTILMYTSGLYSPFINFNIFSRVTRDIKNLRISIPQKSVHLVYGG